MFSMVKKRGVYHHNNMFPGDIVCLQEVGVDYEPFLTAEMGHRGYTGVFCPKEMGTHEGLATFWKRDKFEMVEVRKLSYNSMLAEECVKREIDPEELRGERPHVFLVTKLLHLITNKIITLGNIHTVWDNFSQLDVTTLQVMVSFINQFQ